MPNPYLNRAIPGSPDMMDLFRRMGKKVIYVTNNAIYPTETNVAKLTRLGYKAEKVSACSLRMYNGMWMIWHTIPDNHSITYE